MDKRLLRDQIREMQRMRVKIREQLRDEIPKIIDNITNSGMSLRDLGRKTHLSVTYLRNVKNRKSVMSPDGALKLIDHFYP